MFSNGLKPTRKFKGLHILLAVLGLSLSTEAALFDGCDHTYNIPSGYSRLLSPYHPGSYPAGTSCRYKFVAPLDYSITVNCTINLQKGPSSCTSDHFYLARDGDILLRDSEEFCGAGTFARKSVFRSLVLAYVSDGAVSSFGSFTCDLYAEKQPCDCGWSVNTKIVNGQEATINEYPSMVALKDVTTNLRSYCGGAIISHRYIVTAAHCAYIQTNPAYIEAWVGDHNLLSNTETKYAAKYSISKIIIHPSYTENPPKNDISIFRTTENIEWSRGVGPICLPPLANANNDFAYSYVDVIGWGTTSFAGPTSNTLQKVNLMVTDYQTCYNAYKGQTPIYASHMCTYDFTGTGKDSCQYDSGGPVIFKNYRQYLVAIVSLGKICGEGGYSIGVNTRITTFLKWIYQIVQYSTCNVNM